MCNVYSSFLVEELEVFYFSGKINIVPSNHAKHCGSVIASHLRSCFAKFLKTWILVGSPEFRGGEKGRARKRSSTFAILDL